MGRVAVAARPFSLRIMRYKNSMTYIGFKKYLIALAIANLSLASCGNAPDDPGPGGVTNADAEALDKAAEKLDRVDEDAYRKQIEAPSDPLLNDD